MPQLPDLTQLTANRGGARLSIFLPLQGGEPRRAKTRMRARKHLRRAGQALLRDGVRPSEADRIVGAAQEILEDLQTTPSTSAGLAVFVGPDELHHFQVPVRLPELVVLGDRFTVGPLLPLFTVDGMFFVLALNQDEMRLFQGTRRGMEQVELDGHVLAAWLTMPPPRPAQVHAFVADRGGAGSRAVFHGVGAATADDRTAAVTRHFRGIDRALREVLNDGQAPLVLAAVRNMQSRYSEVNTYPHLIRQGIDGSPRDLGVEALHSRAWPLVEPVLRRTEANAITYFAELHGTGRTADEPWETLAAAERGQVQSLFVSAEACSWADVPHDDGVVRLTDGDRVEEQLELAALATLRHGGEIFVVPANRMPVSTLVGATLRYPSPVPSTS